MLEFITILATATAGFILGYTYKMIRAEKEQNDLEIQIMQIRHEREMKDLELFKAKREIENLKAHQILEYNFHIPAKGDDLCDFSQKW